MEGDNELNKNYAKVDSLQDLKYYMTKSLGKNALSLYLLLDGMKT
jgi:hypothetical protein